MIVKVTKKDIEQGKKIDCLYCPIALAVKRIFPGERIWVSYEYIYVRCDNQRIFLTSIEAKDFINKFDKGEPVSPTTFICEEIT